MPSAWDTEAGGLWVQDQTLLHSEYEAFLDHIVKPVSGRGREGRRETVRGRERQGECISNIWMPHHTKK